MTGYSEPAKTLSVMGETWELVKSATDSAVSFPFERVNITNYSCEKLNDWSHVLIFSGFLPPTPNTLEMPKRLVFIGFPQSPVAWVNTSPDQLRKMHIYKAEMKSFVNEFTTAFLSGECSYSEKIDIKPYPVMGKEKGEDDGRKQQNDAD